MDPKTPKMAKSEADQKRQQMYAFFGLVIVQGAHVLFFKTSQVGGKYHYNTASAIAMTELFKMVLAAIMHSRDAGWGTVGEWFSTVGKTQFVSWTLLAVAYGLNNQLAFYLLKVMGPGQLSLGKSLSPMLTALTMWMVFEDRINRAQFSCLLLVVAGLVEVLYKPDASAGDAGGMQALMLVGLACSITALCSVINAKLLQRGNTPMQVQNILLYSQGFIVNILCFVVGLNPSPDTAFFEGYGDVRVWLVLISQSMMGLVISYVLKHGGAIVKTLAVGVQAALLSVLDSVMFGVEWNLLQATGAVVVLTASYLYFSVALSLPVEDSPESLQRQQTIRRYARMLAVILFVVAVSGGAWHASPHIEVPAMMRGST